jgi:hypothetical protein
MKTDNKWHAAILYQHSDDGNFMLVDDIRELADDDRPKTMVGDAVRIQKVMVKWNNGKPIVDCGDFKMDIVDIVYPKPT